MDCSLADQNSVNCLDEPIRNLTILACGGSPSRKTTNVQPGQIQSQTQTQSQSQSPLHSQFQFQYQNPHQNHFQTLTHENSTSPPLPPPPSSSSPASASSLNYNNSAAPSSPAATAAAVVKLRKYSDRCLTTPTTTSSSASEAKSHTYRISMANLEETQEAELDVILGELSLLEAQISNGEATFLPGSNANLQSSNVNAHSSPNATAPPTRTHSRTNSTISGATTLSISGFSEAGTTTSSSSSSGVSENGIGSVTICSSSTNSCSSGREPRTESPDNDSAFSDTVSLLSSESSASSSASSAHQLHKQQQQQQQQQQLQMQYMQQQLNASTQNSSKAAKIQLALHKLENAPVRRLFVKAFTSDGASKSLLVDERMTCGHVTRMLADKNHVQMQPNWALVENLGDLQMERLFEDHEHLVDNLMTWNSDAGNRVLFQQRADKVALFSKPEIYLPGPQMAPGSLHDEHTRAMLLEEFFESNSQIQVDGPLYMKADSKKGWKRYHFVLRSSGLYYFPKEKTKNTRDLACLTLFSGYNVYRGIGWKKKLKSPTDYTFGFKSAVDSSLGKSCRTLKMLCAEDLETMDKWLTAIRISKYGKQLWDNHKALMDDLSMGDGISNSSFAVSMRSDSISSISSAVPSQCGSVSSAISSMSTSSSGRISRASSSSSSGCLSDDNNGFDSEFTTGTIKRKPSMKPNLPLTTMTRQLKEVGEIIISEGCGGDGQEIAASPDRNGTLTRRHSRRKSQESNGSGTLKRRQPGVLAASAIAKRGSVESMNASAGGGASVSSGSSNSTPTPTPSICAKPLVEYETLRNGVAQMQTMQSMQSMPPMPAAATLDAMTSSTFSLDSLPPPPPPPALGEEHEIYGSQLSLVSLPPPPPPEDVIDYAGAVQIKRQMPQQISNAIYMKTNCATPPAVPAKPIRPAVKLPGSAAPPYKAPPEYIAAHGQQLHMQQSHVPSNAMAANATISAAAAACRSPPPAAPVQKKVSFADSPVLLRRKMCSPEPRSPSTPQYCTGGGLGNVVVVGGQLPLPPRADLARLSSVSNTSSQDFGSPKRLHESTSNPPRDFLKDLQRVMRKKWQVAQKCKLEPATTPHEVLGFRDFSDELHNLNSSNAGTHYYRETANVSNWVQEHYGAGAPPPPLNEYALYENLNAGGNNATSDMLLEPQYVTQQSAAMTTTSSAAMAQRKKRPPPPPPKRSDTTHLTTHRV